MSVGNAKQKAVLSADVMEFGVNVTVDGAKKYYIQALACLSLSVARKLDKPIPQLLGEVAAYFWGSNAVEPVPHRVHTEDDAHEPTHETPKRWIKDSSGLVICPECGEEHAWIDYRASYCDTCGTRLLPEEGNEDYE